VKNLYFLLLFLATSTCLFAQQDAQYSMYRFNGLYINPAYAGSHEVLNATAIYRHQWVRMPGQPQTASVAVHSPLAKDRVGLGLIYTFDKIGVTQTNSIDASFAYRLPVGKKKNVKLCFGLSAGVMNYSANLSGVQTTDASDPNFVGNNQNRWLPNVGFGFYAYSDKFFAGISVPRILANKLDGDYSVFSTSSNVARQYHHLLLTGGYVFNLGEKVKFVPSMLFKYVPVNSPVSFDFNATFVFVDRFWLGAAYRLSDSYNFMAAVNVVPQLKIGYCYDLAVSPLNKFTSGSHEVMLSFDALFKHSQVVSPRHVKYF
jgi:type IX secretion system PorP/SprF family membrane protein